ncbi:hypothetical protein Naga_100785g3 [Nannochloropsis gaditana]|uniref:Uncharacterized protein n=1 Tax=Nannochloropsis gaditana TaxID=72520 RepID=W7TFK9_9STRA|nr:hypothetical protein Naga_100785g3 [Nannochloropsis gaditana]
MPSCPVLVPLSFPFSLTQASAAFNVVKCLLVTSSVVVSPRIARISSSLHLRLHRLQPCDSTLRCCLARLPCYSCSFSGISRTFCCPVLSTRLIPGGHYNFCAPMTSTTGPLSA